MLENQWFAIARGAGESILNRESLPSAAIRKEFASSGGVLVLWRGPSVLVEEDDETFALAVGDTRDLRNMAALRNSGPARHVVICIVEKRTLALRAITDRINFSKIFLWKGDTGGFAISTHLNFLDQRRLTISLAGLACFTANGTQFNNATLFREVSVLERASDHEFRGADQRSTTYWRYGFDTPLAAGAARQRLKDCLIEAVRRQVCDRPVLLSLSGGFDSSGILGILSKYVKPKSLTTFSYVFGEAQKGSDALVAEKMAALTGYSHTIVQAYDGDIEKVIRRNVQAGQGLTNFCDEIDAWHRQGQEHKGAVVLAGDECFGWADRRLVSTDDVMVTICLRKFDFAGAIIPYLDPAVVRALTDALAADVDRIVARNTQERLHDLKDKLYLDHRLNWGLLPWRRFVIGEYFEVREPFLETEVLEVVKSLPESDRIGKALYRKVIQELAPEVFSIPRARTGQAAPIWKREILRNRTAIEDLLKKPSKLDAVIEPAALLALLRSLERGAEARSNWKMTARRIAGPAATRMLRSFVRPETPKFQSPETILLRLLVMREFLSDNPQQHGG